MGKTITEINKQMKAKRDLSAFLIYALAISFDIAFMKPAFVGFIVLVGIVLLYIFGYKQVLYPLKRNRWWREINYVVRGST